MTEPIVLGATAAARCPVKTQHAFTPVPPQGRSPEFDPDSYRPDAAAEARWASRQEHRERVLDGWVRQVPGALDLRGLDEEPVGVRVAACRRALLDGSPSIVSGTLPVDLDGGRIGTPDLLLRGPDQAGGRPGYYPVVVKWHRIIHRLRPPREGEPAAEPAPPTEGLRYGTLHAPGPERHAPLVGYRPRLLSREHDFLQLAHYVRMLAAAGFAAPGRVWAGVVGTDEPLEEIEAACLAEHFDSCGLGGSVITWVDLAEPTIRIRSFTDPQGWALRPLLERYDDEHHFRLAIAETARRHTGRREDPPLLVEPIVNDECATCPWWRQCRSRLDDDDISLRIERGRLDAREIMTLRRADVVTVPQLAGTDVEPFLMRYLPQVRHRPDAEQRLRTAARRARMLVADRAFERESDGPIEVPAAEVEVDFDLETAFDGRIYLWGFRVHAGSEPPCVRQFASFADLDEAGETALAREALGWLRDLVREPSDSAPRRVRVYHYSGFEVAMLKALAARGDDVLTWAAGYAEREFVDLLQVIKMHFFGASGLGLKSIARHAGFRWRDADPGGANSQIWFSEAVHGTAESDRELARRRILEYNEDDVAATAWLRAWLRAQ
jgi:predicted RecB family nuclease